DDELEGHTNEIMKLVVIHNPIVEEDPADVCVVIEGTKNHSVHIVDEIDLCPQP
ncbi:hypothetical protein M9458_002093, partial [Cirrhinus mrigala]